MNQKLSETYLDNKMEILKAERLTEEGRRCQQNVDANMLVVIKEEINAETSPPNSCTELYFSSSVKTICSDEECRRRQAE